MSGRGEPRSGWPVRDRAPVDADGYEQSRHSATGGFWSGRTSLADATSLPFPPPPHPTYNSKSRAYTLRPWSPPVIADLDTLLTALYVELTDRIIPSSGFARSGPGRPPEVTDAELACLAVAQVRAL